MVRTIYFYFVLILYLLATLFAYLWYLILGLANKESQTHFVHRMTRHWGRVMVGVSGSKIEVIGADKLPDENVLYVSNHQSYYDIPLLLGFLPKGKAFVAKIELKKTPIIGLWMRNMGCLFLDRGNIKQSLKVILEGINQLKSGDTLVVFPEGTRSKSYTVGAFKKGSLKLGTKAGVTIVPITIDGSFKMYEERHTISPSYTRIIIHDPIVPSTLTKEEQNNLSETVRDIIIKPILDLQN